jgi:hypothetical protein
MLYASESAIYGRFGFGITAPSVEHRIDRGAAFRDPVDPRLVEPATPEEAASTWPEIFQRLRQRRSGCVSRDGRGWRLSVLEDPPSWRTGPALDGWSTSRAAGTPGTGSRTDSRTPAGRGGQRGRARRDRPRGRGGVVAARLRHRPHQGGRRLVATAGRHPSRGARGSAAPTDPGRPAALRPAARRVGGARGTALRRRRCAQSSRSTIATATRAAPTGRRADPMARQRAGSTRNQT